MPLFSGSTCTRKNLCINLVNKYLACRQYNAHTEKRETFDIALSKETKTKPF